jgi:hypothetical protein
MSRAGAFVFTAFGVLTAAGCSASPVSNARPASSEASQTGPLTLRPGEVAELSVTPDGGVLGGTLTTVDTNERYVVIVASTKFDSSAPSVPWSVDVTGAPPGASAKVAAGCSISADAWSSAVVPPETPPTATGAPVAVGTTKTVHAPTARGFEDIQVKAIAVGSAAVVWADVTPSHPATLDAAFVTQFLTDFESTILPRERTVFGVESDADGDGHIALVFTPLTNQTAVAFFSGCDLVKTDGCATSNSGEYLWMTPPNAIDPPYNTPSAIKEILTHELSHLIHFNRKVLRNHLSAWADSGYMIEGVGGFAQDAIGPQAGNLYVAMAGLDGIADVSLSDVLVDGLGYDQTRDGPMRGGSYFFARWFYDRAGGDVARADGSIQGRGGPALLRALLDSRDSVARTLPTAVKSSLEDIGTDFYTTLAMSNRDEVGGVAPTNPCFAFLPVQADPITTKPRGADVFAKFHGMQMNGVAMSEKPSGTVRTGGAVYTTVSPTANGAPLALTVKVDATAAPRVRVGRLR